MSHSAVSLERFVRAQEGVYAQALAELRGGRKRGHWIWYVLPQLRELGRSPMAKAYGIAGRQEAIEYLAHPLLGPRLIECVETIMHHSNRSALEILGEVDAMKFRSCLTLFAHVAVAETCFAEALRQFYPQGPDPETLRLIGVA